MVCCTKVNEDNKCGMVPTKERKCHDILCCIFFLFFWVGMILIAIIGMKQGRPYKLIYGQDHQGNICGDTKGFSDKKYIAYPRLNDDIYYALKNKISLTEMKYYGICVQKCPMMGDIYCDTLLNNNKNNTNCYTASLGTQDIFYRCLPIENTNQTIDLETCIDPIDALPNCTVTKFYTKECNKICKVKRKRITQWQIQESSPNPILNQIQGTFQVFTRLFGDVKNSAFIIVLVGGIGSIVFGILWLILLQFFAGCMVWWTCILVILSLVILSLYFSIKGGTITTDLNILSFLNKNNTLSTSFDTLSFISSTEETEKKKFAIVSYILWIITSILFLLILAMRSRIKIAVEIIREASRCIRKMPLLILWPMIPTLFVLCVSIYWIILAAYILSIEKLSFNDIATTVQSETGNTFLNNINITTNSSINGLGAIENPSIQNIFFIYHLFGFLWTNQFIQAISFCTIAGAVGEYYWTLPNQFENRTLTKFPIFYALKRTLRYNIGSLCFGSFIIAFVQLIRVIMAYIDHNTKDLQDTNKIIKVIMKIIQCCLWCFEKCLKFLSKNAYIIIAIKGNSFCSAAKKSFLLILINATRVGVVHSISFFLLLLAKIIIIVIVGIITFTLLSSSSFSKYINHDISSPFAPVIITCLFSYFISSIFLNLYDMAIDTLLLCFCEDSKLNNQTASLYMSPELRKIMGGPERNQNIIINNTKDTKLEPQIIKVQSSKSLKEENM